MARSARQHQPLPPGPHGQAEPYDCAGCRAHSAAYPGRQPVGWVVVNGRWYCPRCEEHARRTPR